MVRFTILAALLLVLFAVAEASIYRTTVTTTEIDNESTAARQQCQQEVRDVKMNECQRYLRQSQRGLIMINPEMQVPQQCCSEMREVSEECRCEAVKQMMEQMRQRGEYQGQEMQGMMQKARQLPSMCGMRPQYCDIRGSGYTY